MRQLKISKQVTNRETASLDKYLQEIGKVDLITADEEVELARKIRSGDQYALEKLTKANLRFVVSVSKQYQNQGLSLPDLINEGNLGLIKAAEKWNPELSAFTTYAKFYIDQQILQFINNHRNIKIPQYLLDELKHVKQGIKILVSILSGILTGIIFYYVIKFKDLEVLVTTFFVSIVAYEWGIKRILEFFNITPNNNKGFKI